MTSETFQVDSKLLDELGPNLVGKPATALAELIKNAFDAGAHNCWVKLHLRTKTPSILIRDDGIGMTTEEFKDNWLRVGTTHKRETYKAPFGRAVTGSKGVGRIAVRKLANHITLETVGKGDPKTVTRASLDWKKEIKAHKNLNEVPVDVSTAPGASTGSYTSILLTDLAEKWTTNDIESLAEQTWRLQPPSLQHQRILAKRKTEIEADDAAAPEEEQAKEDGREFLIHFESDDPAFTGHFEERIRAILDIWSARLDGRITSDGLHLSLEFKKQRRLHASFATKDVPEEKRTGMSPIEALDGVWFSILFYELKGKQRKGVKVKDAREYVTEFGGVHIFDSGFRLPYYGDINNDWLEINADHARSQMGSDLLPQELQIPRGQLYLPRLSSMIGEVHLKTSKMDGLTITIQRDRLSDTPQFKSLKVAVRLAIDWYTNKQAARKVPKSSVGGTQDKKTASVALQTLRGLKNKLPAPAYQRMKRGLKAAVHAEVEIDRIAAARASVLGGLATAGITALAFQHEYAKQASEIAEIASALKDSKQVKADPHLKSLVDGLLQWIERTDALNRMFGRIKTPEDMRSLQEFDAIDIVGDVWRRAQKFLAPVELSIEPDASAFLPPGTVADWTSVFQNVLFNAANAMLDSEKKLIHVGVQEDASSVAILISDTGSGIDLKRAEKLFEPFERRQTASKQREGLILGGTGLGLTIVRMVATGRGCKASFVPPVKGFATTFELRWPK